MVVPERGGVESIEEKSVDMIIILKIFYGFLIRGC